MIYREDGHGSAHDLVEGVHGLVAAHHEELDDERVLAAGVLHQRELLAAEENLERELEGKTPLK